MKLDLFWVAFLLGLVLFYKDAGQPSLHSALVKHFSTCEAAK